MKIELEVDIPDGFEATGEYRRAKRGEHYLTQDDRVVCLTGLDQSNKNYIILRKVPRKPTAEHVGENVRVRRHHEREWFTRRLLCITDDGYWCVGTMFTREAYCWEEARVIEN